MPTYAIRNSNSGDTEEILNLLKICLGESTIEKNRAFWEWKHVQNPFGVSPAVVAEAGGRIVGFRTFLQWNWRSEKQEIPSVRAVDTATHPEWQGKGIFSRLTLHLLEEMKEKGVCFIYNTPNKFSKPGYIKMGWHQIAKLPLWVRPLRTFSAVGRMIKNLRGSPSIPDSDFEKSSSSAFANNFLLETEPRYHTARSKQYLLWRYFDIPGFVYQSKHQNEEGSQVQILYRHRFRKGLLELSLPEVLVPETDDAIALATEFLKEIISESNADYAVAIASLGTSESQVLKKCGFLHIPSIGPSFVVRNLRSIDGPFNPENWQSWRCSLGDLEMF